MSTQRKREAEVALADLKILAMICLVAAWVFPNATAKALPVQITDDMIVATTGSEVHSGNGHLDLILLGFAGGGGVNENAALTFDGDDANTDMPTGGSASSVVESYVTSIGEIRDFYTLNFPDGFGGSLEDQITLFVDLSETGTVNHITLNDIQIVLEFDDFPGGTSDTRNDPAKFDIESSVQNGTGSLYSGGMVLSQLAPAISPKTLPLNVQGAGFADYGILTGIDPFEPAYNDDDRILLFWSSDDHDDGGDKVFLSGSVQSIHVPEPATLSLMALAGAIVLRRRRLSR